MAAPRRDQAVVVTGAAGGIGRAIARRLALGGMRVAVNDVDPRVAEVAREIDGVAIPGDCSSEAGVAALVTDARRQLGRIDMWFANAGIDRGRGLQTSELDWSRSLELNLLAHVRAARHLVPEWLERGGGRFVLTASAAGLLTMLDAPAYTVSKHGAIGFAEWLRATYQHRGIIVQAICPQGVETQMLQQAGAVSDVLSHDATLSADAVADAVWVALGSDSFLILPHPKVAGYFAHKAQHPDQWLSRMNRIQQRLEGSWDFERGRRRQPSSCRSATE